jgi:hypothetical protein
MNLDEAIKKLENYPPGACPDDDIEFNKAILLGIEALKGIQNLRVLEIPSLSLLLPGETE